RPGQHRCKENQSLHDRLSGVVRRLPHLAPVNDWGLTETRSYVRICPSPWTTYLYEVSSRSPHGPRACSLSVLMPISAPRPSSLPSWKRVEALTITAAESTAAVNRRAAAKSFVTIASVWPEP